ncbi:Ribonuclease H-like superfamily [Sesbania bispinosa]|nr:Ribonuclease H-like superfamily [Sesbania bispinosa]
MALSENPTLSVEEEDLLLRSTKKSKVGDGPSSVPTRKVVSYKDICLEVNGIDHDYQSLEEEYEGWNAHDLDESDESIADPDEMDEENRLAEGLELLCPTVKLSKEEKKGVRIPWKRTLIVKFLGKRVGLRLGDLNKVLEGGPWVIMGHYMVVQRWNLEFLPFEDVLKRVLIWIRILGLPIEYYDDHVLWRIGDVVGRTIKKASPAQQNATPSVPIQSDKVESGTVVEGLASAGCFGPWMMVQRNNRRQNLLVSESGKVSTQNPARKTNSFLVASRFDALRDEDAHDLIDGSVSVYTHDQKHGTLGNDLIDNNRKSESLRKVKVSARGLPIIQQQGSSQESIPDGTHSRNFAPKDNGPAQIIDPLHPNVVMDMVTKSCNVEAGLLEVDAQANLYGPIPSAQRSILANHARPPDEEFTEYTHTISGNVVAQEKVKNVISLDLLSILEPRVSGRRAVNVVRRCGFHFNHRIEASRFSRGIWILWNEFNIRVEIIYSHPQYVHLRISPLHGGGGAPNLVSMNQFRNCVNYCNLLDGGFSGPTFTWEWRNVKERLDRLLYNGQWRTRFVEVTVFHLPSLISDHKPILLRLHGSSSFVQSNKPFRFLAPWLADASFKGVVEAAWHVDGNWGYNVQNFQDKRRIPWPIVLLLDVWTVSVVSEFSDSILGWNVQLLRSFLPKDVVMEIMGQEPSWIKFNVDGSVNSASRNGGCGGVMRDHCGNWMGGISFNIGSSSVLMDELRGIATALHIAWERVFLKVWIESYSVTAIELISKGVTHNHPYAYVLSQIDCWRNKPWQLVFSHTIREYNSVTDFLAIKAHCL